MHVASRSMKVGVTSSRMIMHVASTSMKVGVTSMHVTSTSMKVRVTSHLLHLHRRCMMMVVLMGKSLAPSTSSCIMIFVESSFLNSLMNLH